jgi:hypothetical protein
MLQEPERGSAAIVGLDMHAGDLELLGDDVEQFRFVFYCDDERTGFCTHNDKGIN